MSNALSEKQVFILKQQEQEQDNGTTKSKGDLCKLTQLKNILRQESPNRISSLSAPNEKTQLSRIIYYQPMNAYDEIFERCYLGDS